MPSRLALFGGSRPNSNSTSNPTSTLNPGHGRSRTHGYGSGHSGCIDGSLNSNGDGGEGEHRQHQQQACQELYGVHKSDLVVTIVN
ncbi:hypothetical protein KEM56_005989, partial [Ascosphaera pollenicola]